jgi:hypothetical protein
MDRFDLFKKYRGKLPFAYNATKGFRNSIRQILEEFKDDIVNIDIHERRKILDIDDIENLNKYINGINKIIDLLYQGLHSIAFNEFKSLMEKEGMFIPIKKELSGSDEKIFYRMRVFESRNYVDYKEMFHVPLDMRGIIKTQRYSFPGYPCLYLGTSINACWEELHRPLLSNSMISMLKLQKQVGFISLVLPNIKEIQESNNETICYENKLRKFILGYPLLISCYAKVNDYSNTYKPEYLIPQLLTEYIISRNMDHKPKEKIFGILYTSAHINNDFNFSDKEFINWAIPVLDPLSGSKYCPILCNTFKITKPTCEEFENIKTGNLTFLSNRPSSNYEASSFFKLESRLKNSELFKIE